MGVSKDALDLLWDEDSPKPKTAAVDPLDALWGSETAKPSTGDIDLGSGGDRPATVKPDSGRSTEPGIMSRDLAPAARSGLSRARQGIADYLNRTLSAGDPNMRNAIERPADLPRAASPRPHQLETVVTTADQPARTHGLATAIAQVMAQTKAGVDTPAPGQELPYDEATFQTYRQRFFDQYNATNDPAAKREIANRLAQLEKQRSEAVALRKEDPISAAGRSATFGILQTPERYAIRHTHEADIESGQAVTPEELKDRGIIEAGERPHRLEPGETSGQAIGEFAGVLPPFEAGERVGMGAVRRLADAIEVGVPRARSIAEALRFAESPVTASTEFGRGAQSIAKGAIRGQLGGAAVGAGQATAEDRPVGETIKAGIVPYAELGALFGAGGATLPTAGEDLQTGAYIADASHMIDATRPDQTPIGDKMPDAHARVIHDLVQRLISTKKEIMTPDERLATAAELGNRARPPEPTIVPGTAYNARPEPQPEPDVPLRTARDITLEREGVTPVTRPEQTTSEDFWNRGRAQRTLDLNTPEGQDARARELLRGQRYDAATNSFVPDPRHAEFPEEAPVDTRPLHEQQDMSKNLERLQEEARVSDATQRLEAASQEARVRAAQPRSFAEELERAGSGDLIQRMKDSDLVQYARRVARHMDTVGRDVQAKVWDEIKGRGLDKKVGPAALALAAVAGATQTEDEDKRNVLLGAAALTTGREGEREPLHEGRPFYSRLERHIESLPAQWDKPRTAQEWMQKLESGGAFSKEEYNRVLKPALQAHAEEVKAGGKKPRGKTWSLEFLDGTSDYSNQTNDPNKVEAWKALYDTRLADGRARIIENEPGSWQRFEGGELVAEGDDHSRRRWEKEAAASPEKMIDIRKTPDLADPKGRLTRQDILDMAQENAIELGDTRLTRGGKSIRPGAATEGETGEGTAVAALRAERAEDVERAQTELDRLERRMGNRRNEAERVWDNLGGRIRDLHEAIERADDGSEGIDVDKIMSRLSENHPEVFYGESASEPALPDDLVVRPQDDGEFVIRKAGDGSVYGVGPTEIEAMAEAAEKRGDSEFGNLAEILGPNHGQFVIRYDEPTEQYLAFDRRGGGRTVEDADYADTDRESLINYIVQRNWEASEPDEYEVDQRMSELRDALDSLNEAQTEYYEHESATYGLREEDPEGDNDDDFQQQLQDAQENDDADQEAHDEERGAFVAQAGLTNYDPEFYDLEPDVQDWVREQRERGAIGTVAPLGEDPRNGSRTPVFDENIPHTPFPREGEQRPTDPDQLTLGGRFDELTAPPAVALPPSLATILRSGGDTHWQSYQRVPGGKNYREILISWDNAPNQLNAGHWTGTKTNTVAHIRATEHNYRPAERLSDKVEAIIDRRSELGAEQAEVLREYNRIRGDRTDEEMMNEPEARAAAEKYKAINQRVEAVEKEYQDVLLKAKKGPTVERVFNAFEHQSDWKQRGEELGYKTEISPSRRADLESRLRVLSQQRSDIQLEIEAIESRIQEEHQERTLAAVKKYDEARTAFRALQGHTTDEFYAARERMYAADAERNRVSDARFSEQAEATADLYMKRNALEAEGARIENELSPRGVADMPWKDNEQAFGLTTGRMLYEAALGDYDRVAWSTSENRATLAGLSREAGRITYDQSVVGATKRLLKGLGFKDVNIERIKLDGYDHWSVKLTPEMKATIKKVGFPVLGMLGVLSLSKTKKDQETSAAALSLAALLVTRGKVRVPRMTPLLEALQRAPGPLAAAGVAALLARSNNKDLQDTSAPLFALALLSAIGTKRMAAARDAIGKVVVENLRKSDLGTKAVRFTNPDAMLSPEVRRAILDYERTRNKGRARATELSGKAAKLGPKGDRAVSDVIENESFEDVSQVKPEDMRAIIETAQTISDEFDRLTQAKVRSGALKPTQVRANYLPRKYAYWEALDVLTENPRPGARKPGERPRIGSTKRRTIPDTDIAERNRLGEIREASYRTALGIDQGYSDLAAAQLFKLFRHTPGVIHPEFQTALDEFLTAKDMYQTAKAANNVADMSTAEAMMDKADLERKEITRKFKLKGGDYVSLPESKTLGVLSGMVVDRDVANSLNGIPEVRKTDKLLKFWKQSKTVFNPGTHVGNILSNVTMAHMGGLRITEQPLFLTQASKDMKAYGPATRALMESGVLDLNYLTAGSGGETSRGMKSERSLQRLAETTRPETEKAFRDVGLGHAPEEKIPTFRKWMEGTRELYNNEDNIFRVAMYLKATAKKSAGITLNEGAGFGMSTAEATKFARDTFGNFRSRSPALRMIRGSVAPFILWPAKALPSFAKNVVDHPVRYMTLMATWGALNEYAKSQVGAVPNEDVPEQDRKRYGYFFPGLTQLPFENPRGDHAATDMARWTPLSGAVDVSPPGTPGAAFSPKYPRILQPSGPLTDVYGKFVNNVDPFTGDQRYKADYPVRKNIGRALDDILELALPSALGFHRERIMADIDNRDTEALKTDILGPSGLRPRYLRAGGNVTSSAFQREKSLLDAKQEARRALSHSQSPERDAEILKEYLEYVDKIEANFQRRAGLPGEKE